MIQLDWVWLPERKRRVRFWGELCRVLRSPILEVGLWSPYGPQLLPKVVEASKDRITPFLGWEYPFILMISSPLSSSSSNISCLEAVASVPCRQGVQSSPYLNKMNSASMHCICASTRQGRYWVHNTSRFLVDHKRSICWVFLALRISCICVFVYLTVGNISFD